MKFFEKNSEYKIWDENYDFAQNITGGAAIGGIIAGLSAEAQAGLIRRKLKAVEGTKKIKPSVALLSVLGGLGGAVLGYGKHLYEKEDYTK